ncbi:hypothetical protein [Qipengyuania flava]|uniref:hypothetical protein n=1 Tax=Qipengyuania flava TaxID=192812 RepID=UPI003BB114A9
MSEFSTGLWDSLISLYKSHGGWKSILASGYFWLAVVVCVFCWPTIVGGGWTSFAQSALPTLAGFSIAAFAIIFAVLSEGERKALSSPEERLGGRSPFLVLTSAIGHAMVTQMFALLYSLVFDAKPIPSISNFRHADAVNIGLSAIGLLLTVYGVVLVLASVLSIYRILEIKARL